MPAVSLLETYGIGQRIQSDSDSFANPPATSNRLYVVESQSRDRLEFAPPKEKAMTGSNATSAKGWVLALTAAASFMVALDALVVTTALSAIRLDLGASIEALEWTVNAYNLCFAVLRLTGAALGDRFGRRRMFAAGLAIFVLASAAVGAYRKLVDRRARRPGCRRTVPAVCAVAMNSSSLPTFAMR
jgi:hypothetical protein